MKKKAGWYKSILEQIWPRNYLLHCKGKPPTREHAGALQTPSSQEESGLTSALDYVTAQSEQTTQAGYPESHCFRLNAKTLKETGEIGEVELTSKNYLWKQISAEKWL